MPESSLDDLAVLKQIVGGKEAGKEKMDGGKEVLGRPVGGGKGVGADKVAAADGNVVPMVQLAQTILAGGHKK